MTAIIVGCSPWNIDQGFLGVALDLTGVGWDIFGLQGSVTKGSQANRPCWVLLWAWRLDQSDFVATFILHIESFVWYLTISCIDDYIRSLNIIASVVCLFFYKSCQQPKHLQYQAPFKLTYSIKTVYLRWSSLPPFAKEKVSGTFGRLKARNENDHKQRIAQKKKQKKTLTNRPRDPWYLGFPNICVYTNGRQALNI